MEQMVLKKIIFFLALGTILGVTLSTHKKLFYADIQTISQPLPLAALKKDGPVDFCSLKQEELEKGTNSEDFYTQWVDREEEALWHVLEKNQISHEEYKKLESLYLDTYFYERDNRTAWIPKGPRLSNKTLDMIYEVIDDFGIPHEEISIISYKDTKNCPAHTDDQRLFIDEQLLLSYTPHAQRFIIAHELQHFINNDDSWCYMVQQKLNSSKKIDDPYNILCRFQEMRADLGAITKSEVYLQGQQEFLAAVEKQYGQGSGISHPKISVRADLGKQVLAFTTHEAVQNTIT